MSSPDSPEAEAESPSDWIPPSVEELAADFPALEIESLLAQGGMSAVYLARQRSLDRRVVLKVLPVEIGSDPDAAARFMREARVLAKLRDPGIVEIYDSGLSPGGHLFLVLEWEEGGDLRHWAQGEVALDDALGIGESVCAALASAHAESIIHGDIKPDNIFLDGKGRLKVGDFGLADIGGEGRAVFHTPGYTAPEIIMGTAGSSPQSDIYAAGAMVFELIYKCVPPEDPAERAATLTALPPAASRVLGQMLDAEPSRRPFTAEACRKMLADARRAMKAVPAPRIVPAVQAEPRTSDHYAGTPLPARPRKRAVRHVATESENSGAVRNLIIAGVVVLGVGVWKFQGRRAAPEEPDRSQETVDATPAPPVPRVDPKPKPPEKDASVGLIDRKPEDRKPEVKETAAPREKEVAIAPAIKSVDVPAPETSDTPPPIDPALAALRKKYVAALTNAAKTAEQAKETSKLPAILTELTLIEKGGSPPDIDAAGTPPELLKLRAIYRKEAGALTGSADPAAGVSSAASGTGKPPLGMPADAIPFNGKWYRYYPECPTWHAAKEKCEKLHGQLAVVPDVETWTFIKGLLGSNWAWMGATDEKNEGVWTWVDGTPFNYTKWQSKEPNNTDGKQHYLRASNKGWRDDAKQARELDGFLCEWKSQ